VLRTSNEVERLFSKTNPGRVKRRFRTEAGITSHLSVKYAARRAFRIYWRCEKSLTILRGFG
jgi:hypothetical protein